MDDKANQKIITFYIMENVIFQTLKSALIQIDL